MWGLRAVVVMPAAHEHWTEKKPRDVKRRGIRQRPRKGKKELRQMDVRLFFKMNGN